MIQKAILLAAGKGLGSNGHDVPLPLLELGGTSLIKRSLLALELHGIHEIIVVVGYRGEEIRRSISSDAEVSAKITWVENPDWQTSSVSSLTRARPYVDGPVLVLSADVLFAPQILASLVDQELPDGEATLLVDRGLHRIYDPASLLKVKTSGDRVAAFGKDLVEYDAVSVGIAGLHAETLEELERTSAPDSTIQGVVEEAARKGRIRARDVGPNQWQLICSPETRLHAEWLLRAFGDDLSGHLSEKVSQPARRDAQRTLSYIEGLLSEKNAQHYVLFNPGPVLTSPRVKSALVHYDVCHRDSDYSVVVRRLHRKLRQVCRGGPEHDIVLLSGSGTAAMEGVLASCIPQDGKLLVVSNGAFGERFVEIAAVHDIKTVHLRHEWGQLINPRDVGRALDDDPEIVAVVMCHHETSVGILNPVHEVGALCRKRDLMFIVDAVSSLAGEDIDVRRDKIDALISSANKCLHAVSGVSFVCIHSRIWPRIEKIPPRVYYLDLKRYHRIGRDLAQTPFTPAVSNFFALDAALDELLQQGVAHRQRHYRTINRRIRKALRQLGLQPFTQTGHESHTITTLRVPAYVAFTELYEEMKGRGYIIYACKEHLKDRYFQIANMGELTDEMVQGFLDTLASVLERAAVQARAAVLEAAAPRAQAALVLSH
jgi:2-aminoethylphosphonate-pyruvate transaminase